MSRDVEIFRSARLGLPGNLNDVACSWTSPSHIALTTASQISIYDVESEAKVHQWAFRPLKSLAFSSAPCFCGGRYYAVQGGKTLISWHETDTSLESMQSVEAPLKVNELFVSDGFVVATSADGKLVVYDSSLAQVPFGEEGDSDRILHARLLGRSLILVRGAARELQIQVLRLDKDARPNGTSRVTKIAELLVQAPLQLPEDAKMKVCSICGDNQGDEAILSFFWHSKTRPDNILWRSFKLTEANTFSCQLLETFSREMKVVPHAGTSERRSSRRKSGLENVQVEVVSVSETKALISGLSEKVGLWDMKFGVPLSCEISEEIQMDRCAVSRDGSFIAVPRGSDVNVFGIRMSGSLASGQLSSVLGKLKDVGGRVSKGGPATHFLDMTVKRVRESLSSLDTEPMGGSQWSEVLVVDRKLSESLEKCEAQALRDIDEAVRGDDNEGLVEALNMYIQKAKKARFDSRGEVTSGVETASRDEKIISKKRKREQGGTDLSINKYFLPQSIIDAIARSYTVAPHFTAWKPLESVMLTGRVSFRSFPHMLSILLEKNQFDLIEIALKSAGDLPEKVLIQLLKALVNLDPLFLGQQWLLSRYSKRYRKAKDKGRRKKQKKMGNGHCNGNCHGVDALVPKAFQSIEVIEPPFTTTKLKKELLLKDSMEPTNGHKNGHVNGTNGHHKESTQESIVEVPEPKPKAPQARVSDSIRYLEVFFANSVRRPCCQHFLNASLSNLSGQEVKVFLVLLRRLLSYALGICKVPKYLYACLPSPASLFDWVTATIDSNVSTLMLEASNDEVLQRDLLQLKALLGLEIQAVESAQLLVGYLEQMGKHAGQESKHIPDYSIDYLLA